MVLNETLQFTRVAPIDNLQEISTRFCNLRVADLAKHEIVAALNPKDLPSPRQFIQSGIEMNPDALR